MRACFILLAVVLAITGCAGEHDLPQAKGPVFQLNPTKWTATADELVVPPEVKP
jgi:hypothetical protein